ncbi:MAG: 4-hydroxy-3-methylbut-2-enyl diphosphate reductase, partial [Raoultibacter sp.]
MIKAEYAGACYGVQRALDLAYAAIADGDSAYTLGPLIHNPQVVDELSAR